MYTIIIYFIKPIEILIIASWVITGCREPLIEYTGEVLFSITNFSPSCYMYMCFQCIFWRDHDVRPFLVTGNPRSFFQSSSNFFRLLYRKSFQISNMVRLNFFSISQILGKSTFELVHINIICHYQLWPVISSRFTPVLFIINTKSL